MTYEEYFTDIAEKYERLRSKNEINIKRLNNVKKYIRFAYLEDETKIRVIYGRGHYSINICDLEYNKVEKKIITKPNDLPPHIVAFLMLIDVQELIFNFVEGYSYDNTTDL